MFSCMNQKWTSIVVVYGMYHILEYMTRKIRIENKLY